MACDSELLDQSFRQLASTDQINLCEAYEGKVLLIVNTASKCGNTPQYDGLEKLYKQYGDDGLVVLGFPSNDFMGQEPGSEEAIEEFCRLTYGVEFPMFEKISVVGDDQHPLYKELTGAAPRAQGDPDAFRDRLKGFGMTPNQDPDVLWNFEKFLIGRDGRVIGRYPSGTKPEDNGLRTDIAEAL